MKPRAKKAVLLRDSTGEVWDKNAQECETLSCLENWQILLSFLDVLERACRKRHARLLSPRLRRIRLSTNHLAGTRMMFSSFACLAEWLGILLKICCKGSWASGNWEAPAISTHSWCPVSSTYLPQEQQSWKPRHKDHELDVMEKGKYQIIGQLRFIRKWLWIFFQRLKMFPHPVLS